MGSIRIPKLILGDHCSVCWGVGKRFQNSPTPLTIVLQLTGIEKGGSWNPSFPVPFDIRVTLQQKIGLPCEYELIDGDTAYLVQFFSLTTAVFCTVSGGTVYFIGLSEEGCGLSVKAIENARFKFGVAEIFVAGFNL